MAIGRCQPRWRDQTRIAQLLSSSSVRDLVHPNICPALVWSRCTESRSTRAGFGIARLGRFEEREEAPPSSSSPDARVFFVSILAQHRHPNTAAAISRRSGIRSGLSTLPGWYVQYVPSRYLSAAQGKRVDLIPHRARPWPCERSTPRPDLPQSPPPTRIPAIQQRAEPGTTTDLFPSVEGAVFFFPSRHVAKCMHACIHSLASASISMRGRVGSQRYCTETVLRSTAMHDPVSVSCVEPVHIPRHGLCQSDRHSGSGIGG